MSRDSDLLWLSFEATSRALPQKPFYCQRRLAPPLLLSLRATLGLYILRFVCVWGGGGGQILRRSSLWWVVITANCIPMSPGASTLWVPSEVRILRTRLSLRNRWICDSGISLPQLGSAHNQVEKKAEGSCSPRLWVPREVKPFFC